MMEKIGKIVLDMTYYPGEDKYSDGAIEDELLEIIQNHPVEEYPEIIEKKKSWPIFYHLSPFRTNIIDWLPIKKTDRVLEIGSGCGALTGALAKKAAHVTCIELSKKRSLMNAYRNQDKDNITIMVGNFQEIEPHLPCDYDYVLLVGVFEYGQSYIGGATPYEDFMRICNQHRGKDGKMIIAIENKFGLKYWAGCREDHNAQFFSGIEGYPHGGSARTFTKKGLEKIMKTVGISEYSFYYPYPDYKFMSTIYSDQYLPKKGELSTNLRNFDRDRMLLFDEKRAFDQIIDEEEFSLFSNSYLVVVGKAPECVYCKFSNDRAKPWAIRTSIMRNTFGDLHVEKAPDTMAAVPHLKNTRKAYDLLSTRYKGTKVVINQCKTMTSALYFPFCKGKTLEELLDGCLDKADISGFKALVDEYMKWLSYGEGETVSNLDFVFPNILVDGDKWHVIDYEWTFEKLIPSKEIAFRAFYNYMLGGGNRENCRDLLFGDILQMTDAQIEEYIQNEKDFQKYITGQRAAVGDMRELIANKVYDIATIESIFADNAARQISQAFFDCGSGYSEENSLLIRDSFVQKDLIVSKVALPEGIKSFRFDPWSFDGVVRIEELSVDGVPYTREQIQVNGRWLDDNYIVFATEDPNIIVACEGAREVSLRLRIYGMPEGLSALLVPEDSKKRKKLF
ncbi:MAG: class I SAM-dependent methyltransferase [Lachnospiraceae bacterium]|nr:class I SAM-dependent methyltransferase [Lachnospiraceae bacterium]